MSESSSLDDTPDIDALQSGQYKRQTTGKTVALLRRERIVLSERLVAIDKEIEDLLTHG